MLIHDIFHIFYNLKDVKSEKKTPSSNKLKAGEIIIYMRSSPIPQLPASLQEKLMPKCYQSVQQVVKY